MLKKLLIMFIVTITVMLSIALVSGNSDRPIVETKSGQIQGILDRSTNGNPYYAFFGIPYAKPPVGSMRFQAPKPASSWNGVRDGSIPGNKCPQIDILTRSYAGDEDCLYLNIYTPKNFKSTPYLLPVLVFIHGGAFLFGSGSDYQPTNFMDSPLVVVTLNYRLAALGFLSTNDKNASGNYGLFDQNLALIWVQNNVERFGGDKRKVTIMGQSAGAALVMYHLTSIHSRGLFSQLIVLSGSSICPWAIQNNPQQVAKDFAAQLGCNQTESKLLINCLRNKPPKNMVEITRVGFPLQFTPTIDDNGLGFISEHPLDTLKRGNIPKNVRVVIGRTMNEGYLLYLILTAGIDPKQNCSGYFETLFPHHLSIISDVTENMTAAINAVEDVYYRNSNKDISNPAVCLDVLQTIFGDAGFHTCIAYTAELLSKAGLRVYTYVYDHIGEFSYVPLFGGETGLYCTHADDLFLLWEHLFNYTLNANDEKVSKVIGKPMVDFIKQRDDIIINKYGDVWPRFNKVNPKFFNISINPKIECGTLSNMTTFWTRYIYLV
ncbi:Carboxylesterase 5A [Chamberlinius hualienensis]